MFRMNSNNQPVNIQMFKIASFGEILWDQFPGYKKPGGSPANVAYHLHIFGNQSYLVSKIGDDSDGKELLQFLKEKKLPADYIGSDKTYPTGVVTVSIDQHNEPSYVIHEPSAWDFITFNDQLLHLSKSLNAICYASLSQRNSISSASLKELLLSVPTNCLKVFDLNLRPPFIQKDVILEKIGLSDVIKMNEDEFETVGSWLNSSDTADAILDGDPKKIIILTMGDKGSALFSKHGHFQHKAYPISNEGDFVGVGDAFLASFTHQLLLNRDHADILEVCNRYAAFVASQKGGMPEVPDELLNLVKG